MPNKWPLRKYSVIALCDEIWIDILSRLSVKTLHVCRCVSKTWNQLISEVFVVLREKVSGQMFPMYGLVFRVATFTVPPWLVDSFSEVIGNYHSSFVSLTDRESGPFRFRSHNDAMVNVRVLDKPEGELFPLADALSLDFNGLCEFDGFRTWHKGLLLTTDGITYNVYNPATKQALVLPRPPKMEEIHKAPKIVEYGSTAAIINLCDSFSPICSFRVVRFSGDCKWAEVYYSDASKWVSYRLFLKPNILRHRWRFMNSVFLEETLFSLTKSDKAVAVKFVGSDRHSGKEIHVYGLPLPTGECEFGFIYSMLGVSQGSLYLTSSKFPDMQIWKHNGDFSSSKADSWVRQFRFNYKQPQLQLCSPVIQELLVQSVGKDLEKPEFIAFHPDCPIVYLYDQPRIYAINLMNYTVEEVVKLEEEEHIFPAFASPYQPCFASLWHGK